MTKAIRYAREKKVPFFGICLGLQTAVIEFARHVAGLEGANSTEFDEEPRHKVIFKLRDLIGVEALGGTMRLGKYPCELSAGSIAQRAYGENPISERHRHRYEVNQEYLPILRDAGMSFTGMSPDRKFVEIIELHDGHPWFLGCQFHPELKSKPFACHPLFRDFIRAAKAHRAAREEETIAAAVAREDFGGRT
jgi:CTP synthase